MEFQLHAAVVKELDGKAVGAVTMKISFGTSSRPGFGS